MSMRRIPCAFALALLAAGVPGSDSGRAGEPAPDSTQVVPAISIVIHVGSSDRDTRRVVYTPPPGWHIRSHHVECKNRYGLTSYSVNTVPAEWAWTSETALADQARWQAGGSAQAQGMGGQADGSSESRKTAADRQRTAASHHALVVEATARGAGWLRGGSGLELLVTAELVPIASPLEHRGPRIPQPVILPPVAPD